MKKTRQRDIGNQIKRDAKNENEAASQMGRAAVKVSTYKEEYTAGNGVGFFFLSNSEMKHRQKLPH